MATDKVKCPGKEKTGKTPWVTKDTLVMCLIRVLMLVIHALLKIYLKAQTKVRTMIKPQKHVDFSFQKQKHRWILQDQNIAPLFYPSNYIYLNKQKSKTELLPVVYFHVSFSVYIIFLIILPHKEFIAKQWNITRHRECKDICPQTI